MESVTSVTVQVKRRFECPDNGKLEDQHPHSRGVLSSLRRHQLMTRCIIEWLRSIQGRVIPGSRIVERFQMRENGYVGQRMTNISFDAL
jgi:hypothetical protein